MAPARLVHMECGATAEFRGNPTEPPDPDRHGNLRVPYRCGECGERTTVLFPKYGGFHAEGGFEYDDRIRWAVPLP